MTDSKRYYWLKLKDDFFSSKRIKKLRRMAGGDTYLIIYLKLQLKSIKSNGIIKFDGVEQSIAEEIALDIDEEVDNVKVALSFLVGHGLAETNDEASFLFFPYAVSNTGSECDSAQRVRKYREQQKLLQCNSDVTGCNTEIDTDKDIEKKKELVLSNTPIEGDSDDTVDYDPLCVYAASELQISPTGMQEIISFRDSMTDDMIRYAIDKAIDNGCRNYSYVRKILNGIVERGFRTLGEIKAAEEERNRVKSGGYSDTYDNTGVLT